MELSYALPFRRKGPRSVDQIDTLQGKEKEQRRIKGQGIPHTDFHATRKKLGIRKGRSMEKRVRKKDGKWEVVTVLKGGAVLARGNQQVRPWRRLRGGGVTRENPKLIRDRALRALSLNGKVKKEREKNKQKRLSPRRNVVGVSVKIVKKARTKDGTETDKRGKKKETKEGQNGLLGGKKPY